MDGGKAFGPCAAEEFGEDGFSLVVESMGRCDCVELPFGQELCEPCVTQAARGFFNAFGGFTGTNSGFGGSIDVL